jgi:hypothetical protein
VFHISRICNIGIGLISGVDAWPETIESLDGDALLVALAWLAGRGVPISDEQANEALRRALVVRAVGGDPTRELELGEEAVSRLAEELDSADARAALRSGLEALRPDVEGRPAARALEMLLADDDLAWRCFAAACVADALGE